MREAAESILETPEPDTASKGDVDANAATPRASVEILYVDGCPHYRQAVELVHLLAAELPLEATVSSLRVADADQARARRFLGSPTVRVEGRDVEPGADERREYALACRVYRTEDWPAGLPDPRWIVWALEAQL